MAPATREQLEATIDEQLATEPSGLAFSLRERKRKRTQGIGLDKNVQTSKHASFDIDTNIRKLLCDKESTFSDECNVIVRRFAAIGIDKWNSIPEVDKEPLYQHLMTKFDIDLSQSHVRRCLNDYLASQHRAFRHDCRKHFRAFSTFDEAINHPYNEMSEDDWIWLCHHFNNNEYKQSEQQSSINLFHDIHHNASKGWVSKEAETNYLKMQALKEEVRSQVSSQASSTSMIDDAICDVMLRDRSGHNREVGYGPEPTRDQPRAATVPESATDLSERINEMEKLLEVVQAQQRELLADNAYMKARLSEFEANLAQAFSMSSLRGSQSTQDGSSSA